MDVVLGSIYDWCVSSQSAWTQLSGINSLVWNVLCAIDNVWVPIFACLWRQLDPKSIWVSRFVGLALAYRQHRFHMYICWRSLFVKKEWLGVVILWITIPPDHNSLTGGHWFLQIKTGGYYSTGATLLHYTGLCVLHVFMLKLLIRVFVSFFSYVK